MSASLVRSNVDAECAEYYAMNSTPIYIFQTQLSRREEEFLTNLHSIDGWKDYAREKLSAGHLRNDLSLRWRTLLQQPNQKFKINVILNEKGNQSTSLALSDEIAASLPLTMSFSNTFNTKRVSLQFPSPEHMLLKKGCYHYVCRCNTFFIVT